MQHSIKTDQLINESYLQNVFPFKQEFVNVENKNEILGLRGTNPPNCQISHISTDSDISDLFSQSVSAEDYKSNEEILLNNNLSINLNSICNSNSNISFQRHLEGNFSQNTTYLSQNIPSATLIQSCNKNNYMEYSNNYQYNSCSNAVTIPSGGLQQFIQCPATVVNYNLNSNVTANYEYIPKDQIAVVNQKPNNAYDNDNNKRIERKRERNREAARKCRERKNQHVEILENKLLEQKKSIDLMQCKLRLALSEMKRLSDYIVKNIPHSDIKNFNEIENEIAMFLDLEKTEI